MNDKRRQAVLETKLVRSSTLMLFKINYVLFPYIIIVASAFSLLEGVTYLGFIRKYFFLDFKFILASVFASGVFVLLYKGVFKKPEVPEYYVFLRNLVVTISLILLIIIYLLYSRLPENRNSFVIDLNYLIYPNRFLISLLILLYFLIVYILCFSNISLFHKKKVKNISPVLFSQSLVLVIVLCWIITVDLPKDFSIIRYDALPIISNPFASYDWKMSNRIGPTYEYYKFVNANTYKDALILNPNQQGQWPAVSNQGFTRYFIYPRNLLSESEFKKDVAIPDFVFMIGDRKLHDNSLQNRWPDFYVPAKKIIYYTNKQGENVIEVNSDYDPLNLDFPEYWGLIEVDKKRW